MTDLSAFYEARLDQDEARLLAEVAAKRAVLELHEPYDSEEHGGLACWTCGPGGFPYPCVTLRALVQPFAGHPDFNPGWAQAAPYAPEE